MSTTTTKAKHQLPPIAAVADQVPARRTAGATAPTLRDEVARWEPSIAKNLPRGVDPQRFMAGFWTATRFSPRINECTRDSVVNTLLQVAAMGLIPSAPGPMAKVALTPRENRKATRAAGRPILELSAIVQYTGLRELAERSGMVRAVQCEAVYANDQFDLRLGSEPYVEHRPALRMRGPLVGTYTSITLHNGERQLTWMAREEAEAIRDRFARGFDDPASPWVTSFAEMVRVKCFRRAMKYVPLNTDLGDALAQVDRAEFGERSVEAVAEIVAGEASAAIDAATAREQETTRVGYSDHQREDLDHAAAPIAAAHAENRTPAQGAVPPADELRRDALAAVERGELELAHDLARGDASLWADVTAAIAARATSHGGTGPA